MMATKGQKLALAGGALVLLVVLGVAFGGSKEDPDAFSWDAITRGSLRETISASGEIQAVRKVNVGTSVAGEIKSIHVKDGQDVKAGDLLVSIDQERLRSELNRTEAALDASRKEAARMEAAMKRARESNLRNETLFKQGLISDEAWRQDNLARESAELSWQAAQAGVAQSQANLVSMRDSLSKTVLRAPIDGRVTSLKAEKGETAIPGVSNLPGATLMVISDMSELMAEIKVNEGEVVRSKVGQTAQVTVESLPGRVFQGRVAEVATGNEGVGQDANMYKVKVALDMKSADVGRLRPGMSARAMILTSEARDVLRVPLQSVLEREGTAEEAQKQGLLAPAARSVVMVAKAGRATERAVTTGIANNQFFEVKAGLAEGEQVLTGPVRKLKDLKDRAAVKLKPKSDTQADEDAKKRKAGGKA
jgi:HlyD family secretion protein